MLAAAGAQVLLLTDEPLAPYDRTALSKPTAFRALPAPPPLLPDVAGPPPVPHRTDTPVTSIDPERGLLRTASGETFGLQTVGDVSEAPYVTVDGPQGLLTLHAREGILVGACGIAAGSGVARPIAAARVALGAPAPDLTGDEDLATVTRRVRAASARGR